MPREKKIQARKKHQLLRETGAVIPIIAMVEHTTVNATHITPSGHRFQLPRVRLSRGETLVGSTIDVRGYRASRDQLAVGCDGCTRKHKMENEACYANLGGEFRGDRESRIDPGRLDQDPEPLEEDLEFIPMAKNGGIIYKANVTDIKGFGRYKAGEISVLITSQEVYTTSK